MRGFGVRALVIRHPWSLDYEILLGGELPPRAVAAARLDDEGRPVYEEHVSGAEMPTLLRLTREEFEAVARAILEQERPEDATLEALRDARLVRDRLLAMFEQRGIR